MADITVVKLKVRRGADSQRRAIVLDQGELGYTVDTARLFVGTGTEYGGVAVGAKNHAPLESADSRIGLTSAVTGDIVNEAGFLYQLSGTNYNVLSAWAYVGPAIDDSTISFNTSRKLILKDNGITGTKFAASAAYSLGGLVATQLYGLSANVDGVTLGITSSNQLSVINIDQTQIKSTTLGNGLTGGSGETIKVSADPTYFNFTSAGVLSLTAVPTLQSINFSFGQLSAVSSGLILSGGTLTAVVSGADESTITNTGGLVGLKSIGLGGETFHFSSVIYNQFGQVIGGDYTITGVMSSRNTNTPTLSIFNGVPDQQDLGIAYSVNQNTVIPVEYKEIDTTSGNLSTYQVNLSSAGFIRFASTLTRDGHTLSRFAIPVFAF
mgnify:FL=1